MQTKEVIFRNKIGVYNTYVHVIVIKGKASMNLRRAMMAWDDFGRKKNGGINNYNKISKCEIIEKNS